MGPQSIREYVASLGPRYRAASKAAKSRMLNATIAPRRPISGSWPQVSSPMRNATRSLLSTTSSIPWRSGPPSTSAYGASGRSPTGRAPGERNRTPNRLSVTPL